MLQLSMNATVEGGKPLHVLEEMIAVRMKLLKQTAKQALNATAVQLIKSLKAATKVAKAEKIDIEDCQGLMMSFMSHGKEKPKPCLRWRGSGLRFLPPQGSKVRYTKSALANGKGTQVFTFKIGHDKKQTTWYIAAQSASEARREAKAIQKRRIEQFKGLAKLAWGILSWKVASTSLGGTNTTSKASATARNTTRISRQGDTSLTLEDNLDYAELALKNGKSDIDLAAAKAANAIAGMINKRLENKGLHERVEIPFPKS